jgi:hypothetical protein
MVYSADRLFSARGVSETDRGLLVAWLSHDYDVCLQSALTLFEAAAS